MLHLLQRWIDRAEPGTLLILSSIMMLISPLFIFYGFTSIKNVSKTLFGMHQTEFNLAVYIPI